MLSHKACGLIQELAATVFCWSTYQFKLPTSSRKGLHQRGLRLNTPPAHCAQDGLSSILRQYYCKTCHDDDINRVMHDDTTTSTRHHCSIDPFHGHTVLEKPVSACRVSFGPGKTGGITSTTHFDIRKVHRL